MRRASHAALGAVALAGTATLAAAGSPPFERWTNHTFHRTGEVLEADGTTLWVGSSGGVVAWDTETQTYTLHTRTANGLADNAIRDLAVDPATGDVWAATGRGVSRLPLGDLAERWETFDRATSPLADDQIQAVAVDGAGAVWIGTFDAGLYRFAGGDWTHFDAATSGLSDDFVTSIGIAPDGDLWVGAWSVGLDRFDGESWTSFTPANTQPVPGCSETCAAILGCQPQELGLISVFVDVLAIDPVSGDLWLRNEDDGFCGLNGVSRFAGGAWSTFTSQNSGLVSGFIDAAAVLPGGDVWLTSLNGTSRFDGAVFSADPGFIALAVEPVGEDLWFGVPEGLVRQRDGARQPFAPGGLVDGAVRALALDPMSGDAWIGTAAGLQRFDGKSWETFDPDNSGLPRRRVGALTLASDGDLWVGLEEGGGVARFDGQSWTVWSSATSGLCCPSVTALAEDALGRLWAGWNLGGLSLFDGEGWQSFDREDLGLPALAVNAIAGRANGEVWVATSTGVARFNGSSWTAFSEANGLPSDVVLSLAIHPQSGVWLGTDSGAARFDGTGFVLHPLSGARVNALTVDTRGDVWAGFHDSGAARFDGAGWTAVTFADGLLSDRVRSLAADPGGDVWLGTEAGLSIYAAEGAPPVVCTPSLTTLCLEGGRFQVEVEWSTSTDSGDARRVDFESRSSGIFWFFDPDNWEMLVKVIDGCELNDRFWVFAAATTDLEHTLTVRDLATGAVRRYSNPAGRAAPAITDTGAFATCP